MPHFGGKINELSVIHYIIKSGCDCIHGFPFYYREGGGGLLLDIDITGGTSTPKQVPPHNSTLKCFPNQNCVCGICLLCLAPVTSHKQDCEQFLWTSCADHLCSMYRKDLCSKKEGRTLGIT